MFGFGSLYSNLVKYGIATLVITIVLVIYYLIAMGFIVKKSGRSGALVLIPIYGVYVFSKAVDSTGIFWGSIVIGVISGILSVFINHYTALPLMGDVVGIIEIVICILSVILHIIFCKNLAACFNKSGGFAAGLFFLNPIFLGILAFGNAQYINGEQANG